tara:strand:+ start:1291 stop:1911 length:621 start_codon:yes stop_codon:yes gene_type:complete
MNIEIKKSIKPIKYNFALNYMEKRLEQIAQGKKKELIWLLEHEKVYTAGTNFKNEEILDKSIKIFKTNRGGKITHHGPGQLVFYIVLNLNERGKNIKKLITSIEKTIISTLEEYKIKTFSDRKDIGIWYRNKNEIKKVAAIGIKVKKWIAYHGFSINISNDLVAYNKIIPCGIKNKKVTNLKNIKNISYNNIYKKLISNFLSNIES